MEKISSFTGKHRFLSNFYSCFVTIDNITYQNSEAAFQAQKTLDPEIKKKFANFDAQKAKKEGKKIKLRDDIVWKDYRNEVMYQVVKAKFEQNPDLKKMLLNTGNALLEEGNTWNDTYWGVCKGKGHNKLGRILMQIREEFSVQGIQ